MSQQVSYPPSAAQNSFWEPVSANFESTHTIVEIAITGLRHARIMRTPTPLPILVHLPKFHVKRIIQAHHSFVV
jgi:hypothetical protein